jgi:hypothetical protein
MYNITDQICDFVAQALAEDPGEWQVDYGVGMSVIVTAQGPVAVTVITLRIPSLLLGETLLKSFILTSPAPTEDEVRRAVRNGLAEMRQERAQTAEEANGSPERVRKLEIPGL